MTLCLKCGAPARWRDDPGRAWCSSHLPNSGQFWSVRQEVAEARDILDELEQAVAFIDGDETNVCKEAAAEIRRLRALVGTETKQEGKR